MAKLQCEICGGKLMAKSGGQCDVGNWKLFQNFDNLEQERTEERAKTRIQQNKQDENLRVIQHRRNIGRCQHCGGEFKGLLGKKCTSCGKPKDY